MYLKNVYVKNTSTNIYKRGSFHKQQQDGPVRVVNS